MALSNYTNGNASVSEVVSLWNPRAQFWFLYALFSVFLLCIAVYSIASHKLLPIFILVSAYLYLGYFPPVVKSLSIFAFISNNLIYFLAGIAFTKYNYYRFFYFRFSLILNTSAFVFLQYIFHISMNKTFVDHGLETLVLACISILFVSNFSHFISKFPNRFFVYIGTSSMAIYLMHILAGSGTRVVLSKLLAIESGFAHLIIGTLAGILLPLGALKLIKATKIPFVFSAPISKLLVLPIEKLYKRKAI